MGDLQARILEKLSILLTSPYPEARATATKVLAKLRGTQYQSTAIEQIAGLLKNEQPWHIEVSIVETLVRLGEREHTHDLLVSLRESAARLGYSHDMAKIIELLLQSWKEETVAWLIGVAKQYNGRGLSLIVEMDPVETAITATDERFTSVYVGKYLSKAELKKLISDLLPTLGKQEERDRAQWVMYQLNGPLITEMHSLLASGCNERVRRLAAEWFAEHGEKESSISVLSELAVHGDGNLKTATALMRLGERDKATEGAWTTLLRTLDVYEEWRAIVLLIELGNQEEAKTIAIELLLSGELDDQLSYFIANALADTDASDTGIAQLRAIAASVQHLYRYEAAIKLGKLGKSKEAYETLLDIAERPRAFDRVKALIALNEPGYLGMLHEGSYDLQVLASRTVREMTSAHSSYNAVAELLQAGIVPKELNAIQDSISREPTITLDEWEMRAKNAQLAFRDDAKVLLNSIPEYSRAYPYAQAGVAQLLLLEEADRIDIAIATLRTIIAHPQVSAQLLLRVGKQLLKLKAREDGVKALDRVPLQSANETKSKTAIASAIFSEKALALNALKSVSIVPTEFTDRCDIAVLLSLLGRADEGKDLLFHGIEVEVPGRNTWMLYSDLPSFGDSTLSLAEHLLRDDPEFVYARAAIAERWRRLGQYGIALKSIEKATNIDGRYDWAWGVRGETLENLGRREEALLALARAIQLNPEYLWAWTFKAELLHRLGRNDEALINIGKVGEIDGSYGPALNVKVDILDSIKRHEEAMELIAAQLANNDEKIRLNAVRALTVIGDTDAIDLLLKASLDPVDDVCETAVMALGEWTDSRAVAGIITTREKAHTSRVRRAAASALAWHEHDDMREVLINALEDKDAEVRGEVADTLGPIASTAILSRIYEIMLGDEEQMAERAANGLAFVKDTETALDLLNRAVAIRPQIAMLQSRLGVLLRRMGRYDEALHAHLSAIQISAIQREQMQPIIYSSLATTFQARGEYRKAAEALEQAIALRPHDDDFWEGLGEALFEMKRDEEAVSAWWRAKSRTAGSNYIMAALGIGLWATNQQTEALRLWKRIQQREPRLTSDWEWAKRELAWGPRMIITAREIVASLEAAK